MQMTNKCKRRRKLEDLLKEINREETEKIKEECQELNQEKKIEEYVQIGSERNK